MIDMSKRYEPVEENLPFLQGSVLQEALIQQSHTLQRGAIETAGNLLEGVISSTTVTSEPMEEILAPPSSPLRLISRLGTGTKRKEPDSEVKQETAKKGKSYPFWHDPDYWTNDPAMMDWHKTKLNKYKRMNAKGKAKVDENERRWEAKARKKERKWEEAYYARENDPNYVRPLFNADTGEFFSDEERERDEEAEEEGGIR